MFLIYYRLVNIFLFDSLQGKAHNLFKVLIEMISISLLIQYIMQMIALTDIRADRQKTLNNIILATCLFLSTVSHIGLTILYCIYMTMRNDLFIGSTSNLIKHKLFSMILNLSSRTKSLPWNICKDIVLCFCYNWYTVRCVMA